MILNNKQLTYTFKEAAWLNSVVYTVITVLATYCCPITAASQGDGVAGDFSAIECISKAGGLTGKPVNMLRLLVSKSLRPHGDTSIDDLALLAKEQGLEGDAYFDLTIAQLRHATFPAVLRVRCSRYSAKPDHFIVCTAIQDDQAHIFNPPASEKYVPLECLATRWQGEALVMAANHAKVDLSIWRYQSYLPTMALLATALVSIIVVRLLRWRSASAKAGLGRSTLSGFIGQAAALLIAAVILSFGSRLVVGQGWAIQAAIPATPEGPDPMDFLLKANAAGTVAEKVFEIDLKEALVGTYAANCLSMRVSRVNSPTGISPDL